MSMRDCEFKYVYELGDGSSWHRMKELEQIPTFLYGEIGLLVEAALLLKQKVKDFKCNGDWYISYLPYPKKKDNDKGYDCTDTSHAIPANILSMFLGAILVDQEMEARLCNIRTGAKNQSTRTRTTASAYPGCKSG